MNDLVIVDNILDITPFKDTVIIGTFFKSQTLKPSVLNTKNGLISKKPF